MSTLQNNFQRNEFVSSKTPFNKKKWRDQKYSNKAKIQRWENLKRKQAERQYSKECKKLNVNIKSKLGDFNRSKSHNSLKEAQAQYRKLQQKNKEKKNEQERIRKERIKAIKAYKEKKAAKFKKLSQKTKKGQPLMKGRIELLLEKIQKHYVNNDNQTNLK